MLRSWRKGIKEQYQKLNGRKYYHWIEKSKRSTVQSFFTLYQLQSKEGEDVVNGWNLDKDFYLENESVFFKLIHHTEKELSLTQQGMEVSPFLKTLNEVFGNRPNKKNLEKFFRNEIIQRLFWPANGSEQQCFFVSQEFNSLFKYEGERRRLTNLLRKVIPAGFAI